MDDPYVYPGTDALKNNLGITDPRKLAEFEREASFYRLNEIAKKPVGGNFDQTHLQAIHRKLFSDIYPVKGQSDHPFAGEIRTIGIQKDLGVNYPSPDDHPMHNLQTRLDYAFKALKKDNLTQEKDQDTFTKKLTEHTAEIWECHAFRDGNTRSTFAFARELAQESGYEFRRDQHLVDKFRPAVTDYARGDREQLNHVMSSLVISKDEHDRTNKRGYTPTKDDLYETINQKKRFISFGDIEPDDVVNQIAENRALTRISGLLDKAGSLPNSSNSIDASVNDSFSVDQVKSLINLDAHKTLANEIIKKGTIEYDYKDLENDQNFTYLVKSRSYNSNMIDSNSPNDIRAIDTPENLSRESVVAEKRIVNINSRNEIAEIDARHRNIAENSPSTKPEIEKKLLTITDVSDSLATRYEKEKIQKPDVSKGIDI